MEHLLEVGHRRVRWVDPDIFVARFAPHCMTHQCRCRDEEDRALPDACCQHGADVDVGEKDAILRRATEIASVLHPDWRDPTRWWLPMEPEADDEFPSGFAVRTGVAGADEASGCVFLQHDARGCALHRAALAHGFQPEEIKPAVCRLYPLAFGDSALGFSDDFSRYSCAGEAGGPTVYRLGRETVAGVFGWDAVWLLDAVERRMIRRRLPLAARG
jgi:Fe-S-cluster containining protein